VTAPSASPSTASAETVNPTPDEVPVASANPTPLRRLAAALGYRDFRVLWMGACTSSIGTWMQKVAQSWLVLELTNSATYLALDAFLGELPIQMTSAFALAGLVFAGHVHIYYVLALSFMSGCAQAFGGPAYQSLIPSLVRKEHLPNAIALNSIQFNIARVLGPLLAGVALHQFGSATCFGLNGLSFLVVIAALLSLRAPHVPTTSTRRMRDELATGLRYVRDDPSLLTLTVLALASTFLGVPLLTFLPVFTKNIYHADVGQYSQMMAWSGVGAIAGALVVAWLGRFRHMGLTALLVQLATGALVVAFALTRLLWLSHVLLLLTGAAMMITFSLFTSLVQLVAPNEMRGRVMSVYMVAFRGGMPLGSLVTGVFVDQAGAPLALAVNGALLTAVAAWFLVRRRPIGDF
jgi:predicted MFS family arabinose efflux permease